ncbi:hypothetical protein DL93DRAFT_2226949 [Clavulina sp. PMI_390]|nr:hypothetical protein DL93DRAFT_2226949 [Clavulina sp. PMI_390]
MVYLDVGAGTLEVWVECGGKRLQEYKLTEVSGPKMKECHVPSEENKEFRVCFKKAGPGFAPVFESHRFDVFLDGKWVAAKPLIAEQHNSTYYIDGVFISATERKTFVFSKLDLRGQNVASCPTPSYDLRYADVVLGNIEEDDISFTHPGALDSLGTIRICLQAVYLHNSVFHAPTDTDLPSNTPISERAKKAGAHASRLGAVRSSQSRWRQSWAIPGYPKHEVTFRYGPIGAPVPLIYTPGLIRAPRSFT